MNHSELDEKILGKALIAVLRKADLFKSLPEKSLKTLAENCKQIRIGDEELLCKEGDSGNKMWVIVSGKLMVFKLKKMIDVLEAGDFLGEMSLIDKQPRAASVRAIGEAHLLEIDDSIFIKYILSERIYKIHSFRTPGYDPFRSMHHLPDTPQPGYHRR